MRKWLRVLAPVAALAIVAAACGDDDDDDGDATETTAAGGATAAGTDTTAAGGGGGTATCEGIAIAFFGAQTGESAALGLNESRAVELALDEHNEANPDCQVEYKVFDSQGDPAQAPGLAQEAVNDESIVAIVGPAFTGESNAANPLFDAAGLPAITPSASNPGLSTQGWTIFHRAIANDDAQAPAMAQYILEDAGASTVAVIDDNSDYGKGLSELVVAGLEEGGATVAVTDSIDPAAQDYSATVTQIEAADVDAVMFGGYYEAAGRLTKQLRDAGVDATFISGDGSLDPLFIENAGPEAAEGAILTAAAFYSPEGYEGGEDFGSKFTESSGEAPGLYSAEAYDATNFILAAIDAGNVDRASILEYISTETFTGITKTFKFQESGELDGPPAIYASTVENGELVGVGQIGA
jgi:branched-chain amino acid transport system substrate-binding protein